MSLRIIIFSVVLFAGGFALADDKLTAPPSPEEATEFKVEAPKVFTSGNQQDYSKEPEAKAPKGATALVWTKNQDYPRGQVEIYRQGHPEKFLRFITESHVFHTMVYFDETYEWRVRYMSADDQPVSEFSEAKDFTVLRKGALNQYASRALAPTEDDVAPVEVKFEKPVVLFESDGTPIAMKKKTVSKKNGKSKPLTPDKLPARLKQPDPFVVMQAPTREPQAANGKDQPRQEKSEPLFEDSPEDNGSADFDY